MNKNLKKAFVSGAERVAAWADILDNINVFPVADGDTGRNLVITLAPLRVLDEDLDEDLEKTIHKLLISARGNSGNIAARFFSGFMTADSPGNLPQSARLGRSRAWEAVADPIPGTMLTVFDALAEILDNSSDCENLTWKEDKYVPGIISHLEEAVRSTPRFIPMLKKAGVVDSGALGMFIYLEGFFKHLAGTASEFRPVSEIFKGMVQVSPSFDHEPEQGYCVDMVICSRDDSHETIQKLSNCGESVVAIPDRDCLKVHMHTDDREDARKRIQLIGDIVQWSDDDIRTQVKNFKQRPGKQAIHIMTDAAGSVTYEDSRNLGITLLNSYITAGDKSLPETFFTPSELYRHMRDGLKVSTSQASTFERHQCYQSVLDQHRRVLYLCVGSVFTGNYDIVTEWKQKNDHKDRLTVIDTGAASGRLGLVAIATARYSGETDDADSVICFAKRAVECCEEYVFLDRLKYLAAGGRLSKPGAFFGDMLHMKPVISPKAEGAKKVGVVRNQDDQLKFAFERLSEFFHKDSEPVIMLEYSDNFSWVNQVVKKETEKEYPFAEILLRPLSLTSGAHMGPGTWAIVFLTGTKQALNSA